MDQCTEFLSGFQSLSSDIANHHARLIQLLGVARSLEELVQIEDPEDRYGEALDVIIKLQEDVESSLRRLLAFRERWTTQEALVGRLESWMNLAERDLAFVRDPSGGNMRQFWVSCWNILLQYVEATSLRYSKSHNPL